jgi:anti-sigma B factor antagonist
MTITTRQVGDVCILDISGRLSYNEGAFNINNVVMSLSAEGKNKFIVSLEGVTSATGDGLCEIVVALNRIGFSDKKLLCPNEQVMGVLKQTQLDNVFQVFYDEKQAVKSFR